MKPFSVQSLAGSDGSLRWRYGVGFLLAADAVRALFMPLRAALVFASASIALA